MGDLTSEQKIARLRSAVASHQVMDRRDALATLAALDAARAEIERLTAERDIALCAMGEAQDGIEKLATALGVTDYVCSIGPLLAEIERLRTAAADERADVVAQLTKLANFLGRAGTKADTYASDVVRGAAALLAAGTHEGAHVGAAKGGER